MMKKMALLAALIGVLGLTIPASAQQNYEWDYDWWDGWELEEQDTQWFNTWYGDDYRGRTTRDYGVNFYDRTDPYDTYGYDRRDNYGYGAGTGAGTGYNGDDVEIGGYEYDYDWWDGWEWERNYL